jgi:hypothetical protein
MEMRHSPFTAELIQKASFDAFFFFMPLGSIDSLHGAQQVLIAEHARMGECYSISIPQKQTQR